MYGRTYYAGGAYAGPAIPNVAVPGEHLPPPVPGGTTSFVYTMQVGAAPWAFRSWGGGSRVPIWPGGGMVVIPTPDLGVMDLRVWWPDAPQLQVIRISPDGTRTPVRGAYPVSTSVATRRNYCANPSLETSLAGYVSSDGSPSLTTIAGWVGTNALRATVAGAGSNGVTIPHSLPVSPTATIALQLAFSARPTAVTISVGYLDSVGGALTSSSVVLTADQINNSVTQWARQAVVATAPVAAATVGSIKVLAAGMPMGGQMDIDAVTIEKGATGGSAFDGETLGGSWSGTQHLSTSVLAPVLTVLDGEAPLDTGVYYELYNPRLVGGRITSPVVVLDSQERVWLTHPSSPDSPVECLIASTPDRAHVLEQGVNPILDSEYPVVVSASLRRAPAGDLTFLTETFADRDRLIHDLFGDGTPVLLRTPYRYGYDEGMWIVLGNITEIASGQKPWEQIRELAAPFQVVESPADTLVA